MNLKDTLLKIKERLPKSKSLFLIVIGVVGLLLILISSFGDKSKTESVTEAASTLPMSKSDKYVQSLENKLEVIISDMLSGTDVSVMITLNSGIEYVYADETKIGSETKADRESFKTEQSDSNQKNLVIFKDSEGNEQALIITEKMPEIRGVVVICEGGQSDRVSVAVKTAVGKALSVSEDKICVLGRN